MITLESNSNLFPDLWLATEDEAHVDCQPLLLQPPGEQVLFLVFGSVFFARHALQVLDFIVQGISVFVMDNRTLWGGAMRFLPYGHGSALPYIWLSDLHPGPCHAVLVSSKRLCANSQFIVSLLAGRKFCCATKALPCSDPGREVRATTRLTAAISQHVTAMNAGLTTFTKAIPVGTAVVPNESKRNDKQFAKSHAIQRRSSTRLHSRMLPNTGGGGARLCSVCPPVACALIKANVPEMAKAPSAKAQGAKSPRREVAVA